MKIQRLLPLVSALGIGLFATSCNHYYHSGHAPKASVGHYRPGYITRSLPPRYQTMNHGGIRYYYHDNVYYRPHNSGYIVVENPRGRTTTTRYYSNQMPSKSRILKSLPGGYSTMSYKGLRYYRHGDNYYQQTRGGYRMVDNPYSTRGRWR